MTTSSNLNDIKDDLREINSPSSICVRQRLGIDSTALGKL